MAQTEAPETQAPEPARKERDATFDVLKGIAIVEVVALHCSGFSMRNFATKGSWLWWALGLLVAVLQVCVPTFLLSSAITTAMSAAKRDNPDWKAYYWRRTTSVVAPYLLWTAIYIGLRYFVVKAPSDLKPEAVSWLGVSLPHLLTPGTVAYMAIWGKSQFHMYFLAVLLQFLIVFPAVFLGMRRWNPPLWMALLVSLALQGVVYALQIAALHLKTPASTFIWYIAPLMVGVWLGLQWREWPAVWQRYRWTMAALTLVGGAIYVGLRARVYAELAVTSWMFNGGFVLYTLGLAVATLAFSAFLAKSPQKSRLWTLIGERSLAIFFIHPVILTGLGSRRILPILDKAPLSPLVAFVLVCGITWLVVDAIYRLKANRFLFGR